MGLRKRKYHRWGRNGSTQGWKKSGLADYCREIHGEFTIGEVKVAMEYIAYLHKNRKSDFGVGFPDFPGLRDSGQDGTKRGVWRRRLWLCTSRGMMEDGDPIPEPSTIDDVAGDLALKGAVAFLVNVDVGEKAERFNITARRSQMEEIDRLAEREGMTRSAYMVGAGVIMKTRSRISGETR
jgi:HicB_like antitoxin of bacterial toxin-antitoxin system